MGKIDIRSKKLNVVLEIIFTFPSKFLNNQTIQRVFDLNPLKENLFTPGSYIKIEKPIAKKINKYDVIFLLAWNFKDEIIKFLNRVKFKGDVIIPLPNIKLQKLKR